MRSRVYVLISGLPDSARETVEYETPAAFATSLIVTFFILQALDAEISGIFSTRYFNIFSRRWQVEIFSVCIRMEGESRQQCRRKIPEIAGI